MAAFRHMVSMERTLDEKAVERVRDTYPPAIQDMPDVPGGLCIVLTEVELDKMEIEDDPEVGDMIHISAMGKVTCVSNTDTGSGVRRRVEISLVSMAAEDESTEATDEGLR